jgi:hypothetical protein
MTDQPTAAADIAGPKQTLIYEDWLSELGKSFAKKAPAVGGIFVDQCGVESWRDYYEDGYSPNDAADSEMSYWEDD